MLYDYVKIHTGFLYQSITHFFLKLLLVGEDFFCLFLSLLDSLWVIPELEVSVSGFSQMTSFLSLMAGNQIFGCR